MLQLWVIVLFAVLYARDSLHRPLGVQWGLLSRVTYKDHAAWWTLGGIGVLIVGSHVLLRAAARRVERQGSWGAVVLADRTLMLSRIGVFATYAAGVLVLGWVDWVRAVLGDLVAVDELVAMSPALLAIVAGWWSYYPIERRLRESIMVRQLDEGKPVYPVPSCGHWVLSHIRHDLLLTGIPVAVVLAWNEGLKAGVRALSHWTESSSATGPARAAVAWLMTTEAGGATLAGVELLGVLTVFLCAPLVVRLVWDTVPLSDGPLRDRLMALCRAERVRVRQLLVWRTYGSMVNGAVVGLLGRLRYILLTDALLGALPARQIEAVMAHEIAHIRRRHIGWYVICMLATALLVGTAASVLATRLGVARTPGGGEPYLRPEIELAIGFVSLALGLVAFGFVSRRFEWQADAFAAAHLSHATLPGPGEAGMVVADGRVTTEAVNAMAGALESVARLNHVPRKRFSWRHGSIADRQEHLRSLIGLPINDLPIDHTVRRLKRLAACGLAAAIGLAAWTGLA